MTDRDAVLEEVILLTNVLNRARETLLISIKGTPEELQRSLGRLNLACKAHWGWQTERLKTQQQQAAPAAKDSTSADGQGEVAGDTAKVHSQPQDSEAPVQSAPSAPLSVEHIKQEILDLFARYGSGDYEPTENEKSVINETLDEILRDMALRSLSLERDAGTLMEALRTISLRCGYIINFSKDLREARLEGEEMLRIATAAMKGKP